MRDNITALSQVTDANQHLCFELKSKFDILSTSKTFQFISDTGLFFFDLC